MNVKQNLLDTHKKMIEKSIEMVTADNKKKYDSAERVFNALEDRLKHSMETTHPNPEIFHQKMMSKIAKDS